MVLDRGHVARREHVRVRDRAQRVVDPHEPARVGREAGGGEPRGGARLGHPKYLVGGMVRAVAGPYPVGRDLDHPHAGMHRDAALGEHAGEARLHPAVMRGKHGVRLAEQMERGRRGAERGETVLDGEQYLHPARPAADDRDAHRAVRGQHAVAQPLPPGEEPVDRLHPGRVGGRAGHVGARGGADVERQHVVGHRRARPADDLLGVEIEPGRLVDEQARAGEAAQPLEVDMRVVEAVMPGDQTRQHARVGRVHVAADQRQAHARHGPHAEPLEDGDMAVPAADQHQILDDGGALHRPRL